VQNDCCFTHENNWFRYRAAAIILEDGCVLLAGNEKENYLYSVGGGVQMNETAQDAVLREVFEETGVHYEIDRLAVIHENFWQGGGAYDSGLCCHELALYFLMKPRGTKQLQSSSLTRFGDREKMHWVPVNELHTVKHFPTFLQSYLQTMPQQTVHVVERENT